METSMEKKKNQANTFQLEDRQKEKWVLDSSVDHKGRIPLRTSTGSWRASLFIIAIEFSERLSYFGISTNLIIYLTKVLHQSVETAAKNVNNFSGVILLTPLIGGFVADAYLGRFYTVIFSTIIYILGLVLLTMSQLVPPLKPCSNPDICHRSLGVHQFIFFLALYVVAVGTGGHKASLESFGADQFDDGYAEERKKKMSFFNWWNFGLCCGLILAVTIIVYVQDHVGWDTSYIILTAVMATSLLVFIIGRSSYRFRRTDGSPFTPLIQVLAAAIAKRHLPLPDEDDKLYEIYNNKRRLLSHTYKLRFLDKAAIIEHKDDEAAFDQVEGLNSWRLATITQVEELKLILSMVPVWLTTLPFGLCVAQTSTFFIKQASIMDRKISRSFEIPPASVYALGGVSMIITVCFYDKVLVPFLRKVTGKERGISILQRMGIGMVFSAMAMASAAIVERNRLKLLAGQEGGGGGAKEMMMMTNTAMSVWWLVPQYMILGFGDGFTLVGLQEYFYDQVPDGMRSLGIAMYIGVIGVGNFISSLLITVVEHVTEQGGGRGSWLVKDLNSSRLDLYYWLLFTIVVVDLCAYVHVASRYTYKNVQQQVDMADQIPRLP